MKKEITLEQEDFDAMHDVILGSLGYKPTNEQIQEHWKNLPEHIRDIAIQWGCNDTVFRDDMYVYLQENNGKE